MDEAWSNLIATTGTSGGEPRIVLCDPEDNPVAFLDYADAAFLAHEILSHITG